MTREPSPRNMQSVHLFTGFVLIRKLFGNLAVSVLQDEKQRISGLSSSEHSLHVICCIWNVGSVFHTSNTVAQIFGAVYEFRWSHSMLSPLCSCGQTVWSAEPKAWKR